MRKLSEACHRSTRLEEAYCIRIGEEIIGQKGESELGSYEKREGCVRHFLVNT